uniref:Uncharacterized protein n=1 Tax=Schistocephalus solidus TaxID=70667 RepID=A0A0X3Q1A7_SCHSO
MTNNICRCGLHNYPCYSNTITSCLFEIKFQGISICVVKSANLFEIILFPHEMSTNLVRPFTKVSCRHQHIHLPLFAFDWLYFLLNQSKCTHILRSRKLEIYSFYRYSVSQSKAIIKQNEINTDIQSLNF